jgi:hypothetical protein
MELKRTGTTEGFREGMWRFDDFSQFMGIDARREEERDDLRRGIVGPKNCKKNLTTFVG